MAPMKKYFSGRSLDQAVTAAASHFGVGRDELAYEEVDKRHGFVRTRRKAVISVDPDHPTREAAPAASEAPAPPSLPERDDTPRRPARSRRRDPEAVEAAEETEAPDETEEAAREDAADDSEGDDQPSGRRRRRSGGRRGRRDEAEAEDDSEATADDEGEEDEAPRRGRRRRRGRGRRAEPEVAASDEEEDDDGQEEEDEAIEALRTEGARHRTPGWWHARPVRDDDEDDVEDEDDEDFDDSDDKDSVDGGDDDRSDRSDRGDRDRAGGRGRGRREPKIEDDGPRRRRRRGRGGRRDEPRARPDQGGRGRQTAEPADRSDPSKDGEDRGRGRGRGGEESRVEDRGGRGGRGRGRGRGPDDERGSRQHSGRLDERPPGGARDDDSRGNRVDGGGRPGSGDRGRKGRGGGRSRSGGGRQGGPQQRQPVGPMADYRADQRMTALPDRSRRLDLAEGEEADAAMSALEMLLEFCDIEAQAEIYQGDDDRLEIELWGPDDDALLADDGKVLLAMEHLLPRMIRTSHGETVPVRVDCDNFHMIREERLRDLAQRVAGEVARSGKPRTLDEMDPAERRIIHITLADDSSVDTESIGRGYTKRVKIVPR